MISAPQISICIPAYKADRYLNETLSSIRAQSFSDWELIVTEDGCRDRTEELVREFASTVTQNVCYTRNEENQGLPATRNAGITLAHAEWIALLDSDDLWTPKHLETLLAARERIAGAELVHAGSILFDSDTGREIESRSPSPEIISEFPLSLFDTRYIIQPASVMLKKSLWQRVGGFNPAFRYVEDREMWLRCVRAGATFAYTGHATCRYRKHSEALSTRSAEMAEAAAAVFDQHLDWEEVPLDLRQRLTAEMWASAGKLRQRTDPKVAASHFRRACCIEHRWNWYLRAIAFAAINYISYEFSGNNPKK